MQRDIFAEIAIRIIKAQETIIGPVALEQANRVDGLKIDWSKKEVSVEGDKKAVIDKLIAQYEHLFGRASIEVCRDAVKGILREVPEDQVPGFLATYPSHRVD